MGEVCRSRSTQHSIGPAPLVPDPYESSTVEVRFSQVEGGGEGLYARRNVAKGEIVAFYNGIRLPPEHRDGTPESWETSGYKIFATKSTTVLSTTARSGFLTTHVMGLFPALVQ